jgi:hypothetical protein
VTVLETCPSWAESRTVAVAPTVTASWSTRSSTWRNLGVAESWTRSRTTCCQSCIQSKCQEGAKRGGDKGAKSGKPCPTGFGSSIDCAKLTSSAACNSSNKRTSATRSHCARCRGTPGRRAEVSTSTLWVWSWIEWEGGRGVERCWELTSEMSG